VQDHQKAVDMFEQQRDAKSADSELQSYINNTLPTLQRHLTKAQSIQRTLSSSDTTNTRDNTRSNTRDNNTRDNNSPNNSPNNTPNNSPNTPNRTL